MKRDLSSDCARWREQLTAYHLGELTARDAEAVRRHLETCGVCRTLSREIAAALDLARDALADPAFAPHAPKRLSPERRERVVASVPLRRWRWEWNAAYRLAALLMLAAIGIVALMLRSTDRPTLFARESGVETKPAVAAAKDSVSDDARDARPMLARAARAASALESDRSAEADVAGDGYAIVSTEPPVGAADTPVVALHARHASDTVEVKPPVRSVGAISGALAGESPSRAMRSKESLEAEAIPPVASAPTADIAMKVREENEEGGRREDAGAGLAGINRVSPTVELGAVRRDGTVDGKGAKAEWTKMPSESGVFAAESDILREISTDYPEAGERAIAVYPALIRGYLPPHRVWLCVGLRVGDVPAGYVASVAVVLDAAQVKSVRGLGQTERMSPSAPLEIALDSLTAGQSHIELFEIEWSDQRGALADGKGPVAKVLVRHGDREAARFGRLVEMWFSAADWTERGAGHAGSAPYRLASLAAEFIETFRIADKSRRAENLRLLDQAAEQMVREMPGSNAVIALRDRIARMAGLPVE